MTALRTWLLLSCLLLALLCMGLAFIITLRRQVLRATRTILQREAGLRERERYLHTIIQTSVDGFWVIDVETRSFRDVNTAYCVMSGYARDELLGLTINDLEVRESPAKTNARIQRIITHGSEQFETTHRRKDGSLFPVELSVTHMEHETGGCLVCFCRDITERKQAQAALQQKSEEMENFVYTISHDLKSPLVTVKTFLGLLQQDLENTNTARVKADIGYIQGAADKIEQLLDALLQLSRIGRSDNPPTIGTARDLINTCLAALAGPIQQKRITASVADLPQQLHGDPLRLGQIWQNLIENAIKYMGDQPHPRIEIGVEQQNGDTIFYVRDNGIGIAPADFEKVFRLFSQLEPESEGSGLGLALVKKIVELYGGHVWIESDGPGRGSCFRFTLPAALTFNLNRDAATTSHAT